MFYFYFQLIKIQHKYPSLKKKRLNSIIHVTIGLRKKIQLNNSNLSSVGILEIYILQMFFYKILLFQLHESSMKSDYSMNKSSLSKSSRVTPHETTSLFSNIKLNNNDELDRTGMIQDYHQRSERNKRKKSVNSFRTRTRTAGFHF